VLGLDRSTSFASVVPAGTVCFAWALRGDDGARLLSETRHFDGSRNVVRRSAVVYALERIPHYHSASGRNSAAA